MEHGTVVPNCEVIDILPFVADLQVMIFHNKLNEPVEKVARLGFAKSIDLLDVMARTEDALPACDGVCADHWVDGFEELANVLRRTALGAVDLEAIPLGSIVKSWLSVCCGQSLEKLLEWLRNPVVDLVAGSPQSV